MTDQERAVSDLLVTAWNAFVQIEATHPDHAEEFRRGIHTCQSVLACRIVQRDYPDDFPSYNQGDCKELAT